MAFSVWFRRAFPRKTCRFMSASFLIYYIYMYISSRQAAELPIEAKEPRADSLQGYPSEKLTTHKNNQTLSQRHNAVGSLHYHTAAVHQDRGNVTVIQRTSHKATILSQPDIENSTLVIFVQSEPWNFDKRSLQRSTWANLDHYGDPALSGAKISLLFSLGTRSNTSQELNDKLQIEIQKYRDILQLDFSDSYENLTLKGLLTMTWIRDHLPETRYVVKTDDDVFLNVFFCANVIRALEKNNMPCAIVGYVWNTPEVKREGKYIVSRETYNLDYYPSFCSGAGYLMSRDALVAILEMAAHVPLLLRDDPYFTGILADEAGIPLYNIPHDSYKYLYSNKPNLDKQIRLRTLLVHGIPQSLWLDSWTLLRGRLKALEQRKPARDNKIVLLHQPAWDSKIKIPKQHEKYVGNLSKPVKSCLNPRPKAGRTPRKYMIFYL